MERSLATPHRKGKRVKDKRAALLSAALDLFARAGLQGVPTSAISRKAGVAKGTLFMYFETKTKLINELYLEVTVQYTDAMTAAFDAQKAPEERLRMCWFAYARWYLNQSAAATFMLQCEVSSILTQDTQTQKAEMDAEMVELFIPDKDKWRIGSMTRYVSYALFSGPVQVLAQMRDKGEIEITKELLEKTFACVERALNSIQ